LTTLSFHPTDPSTLLSASTDGLISIFDTRLSDEDDALTQVLNHQAAVHCAGFIGPDHDVYALSSDEQMAVYALDLAANPDVEVETRDGGIALAPETESSACMLGDVRPLLQCAYVVDVVRAASSTSQTVPAWVAAGDTS